MLYLCAMFPCSLFDGKKTEQLKPFIFYEISNVKDENVFCCGHNCEVPFVFNLYEVLNLDKFNLNVQKVAIKLDTFIFLKAYRQVECDYFNFKSGNKKIDIVISK